MVFRSARRVIFLVKKQMHVRPGQKQLMKRPITIGSKNNMKKAALILILNIATISVCAQATISGTVEDRIGGRIPGANVYILGSYDGFTTGAEGAFSFNTPLTGSQTLVASFIGYETHYRQIEIERDMTGLRIVLFEEASELDEVVIIAGTFEAGDESKSVILSAMDVALTASAKGDIFGAFSTLPGSHHVGDDGRLFVRGGESYETKVFMDGMLINTPYFSKMPDVPTRGRFSPLFFRGAVFSTGGYSAEFGQALSSVVALNTTALEPEDRANISVMSVGVQGSAARRGKNRSLAMTGELLHTGLSNRIFRQRIDWIEDPVIAGSTFMFRQKTSETGMIKTFGSFSHNRGRLMNYNFRESVSQDISMRNNNAYINTTFNEQLNDNWLAHSGIAVNLDHDDTGIDNNNILAVRRSLHGKAGLTNLSVNRLTTKMGLDYHLFDYSEDIRFDDNYHLAFSNQQYTAFVESEAKITTRFALRAGIRAEYSSLLEEPGLNPRLSAALRTGKNSQVSAAYGKFIQNPEDRYLRFTNQLEPERSEHYILTWQYIKGTYTLRLETYHKNYSNLVRYREEYSAEPGNFDNTGSGYARGLDVFWRNKKPFGRSDYWISYSWCISERLYRDYPVEASPGYLSSHSVSAVYKRFITSMNSFVSATGTFATGRPYFNPNNPVFMDDRAKPFRDISVGYTRVFHLFSTQTVLHLVVNNLFGFDNVFGYTFSANPDEQGLFRSQPIRPPQKRMAVILLSFEL